MKSEPPLAHLIARCLTVCEPSCCGLDAFDFSPVNIAYSLTVSRGAIDAEELAQLRKQLVVLKQRYGVQSPRQSGVTIEYMNENFSAQAIDSLADEISHNLNVAIQLVEQAEVKRFKKDTQNQYNDSSS